MEELTFEHSPDLSHHCTGDYQAISQGQARLFARPEVCQQCCTRGLPSILHIMSTWSAARHACIELLSAHAALLQALKGHIWA